MEFILSIILGFIEGITEWLPISSTGHMILFNEIIDNTGSFLEDDLYLYVIQLGAIMAVVTLFFNKLNPFSKKKTPKEKNNTWQMWFKVVVACIPTGIIGLTIKLFDVFDISDEQWLIVSVALIIYGIAFIVVEKFRKKTTIETIDKMPYKTALAIGAFQLLSIVPGTSRSGSTILGGILMGCSRTVAAEFSFFLAIPVMFGMSFYEIVTYNGEWNLYNFGLLAVGMVVAYAVSLVAIKFLVNFVKKHSFSGFGWYRIVLGILVISYFLVK